MNIKSLLKQLKLSESSISMALGAIVIVVVGFLVVNYFKGADSGSTIPSITTEDVRTISLPTLHTVEAGEDLWKISEKYYETGYNWVDIANENDIANPGLLEKGQILQIPDVESRLAEVEDTVPEESLNQYEPSDFKTSKISNNLLVEIADDSEPIDSPTYTVVPGDTLWDIAVRAYGDGYRWTDIAAENHLANPDLIHAGNVFVLPD